MRTWPGITDDGHFSQVAFAPRASSYAYHPADFLSAGIYHSSSSDQLLMLLYKPLSSLGRMIQGHQADNPHKAG
jgi:phage terminase large subunit-like protein